MNNKIADFIKSSGVSREGFDALTIGATVDQIETDIALLKNSLNYFDIDATKIIRNFNTKLWTLLGEIATPNNLGLNMPEIWPLLVFPSGMAYKQLIADRITDFGGSILKEQVLEVDLALHAGLYAGQAWYPSLRLAFAKSVDQFSNRGLIFWIGAHGSKHNTLAAIARKMQLQVRPKLPEYKIQLSGLQYPGIQRAFHTPRLDNVAVHCLIFYNS